MIESVLKKYIERRVESEPGPELVAETDTVGDADGACFRCIRGSARERAAMLELHKADGSIRAITYSYVEAADFDPSDGITLHVAGKPIRVKGRNLNRPSDASAGLFSNLTAHRVLWIKEADRAALVAAEDAATVIESIEW